MSTMSTPSTLSEEKPEANDLELSQSRRGVAPSTVKTSLRAVGDVVAGFFLMFNSWGIANSFGLFQTYYKATFLSAETDSTIAWIGSVQTFLVLFVGIFIGPIYDAGFGRQIVAVGSFMIVFGLMMTSISTEFYQVMLAQGICTGIGCGCMITPILATIIAHFPNRTNVAMGFAASGSAIGAIIYPVVFHKLLPKLGFPWTTRVFAFMVLGTQAIALVLVRPKARSKQRRPIFDASMIHNLPYCLFTLGGILAFMGLYEPFFYVQTYAASIHVRPELAFYTLVIINAGSAFGRIIPNFFAHKIGSINTAILVVCTCGILNFCWIAVRSQGSLIAFCVLYGFFSGTFVSINGQAINSTCDKPDLRGTHLGMSLSFGAFGVLIGSPLAGVLLQHGGWVGPQTFSGAACIAAVISMVSARVILTNGRLFALG